LDGREGLGGECGGKGKKEDRECGVEDWVDGSMINGALDLRFASAST